MEWLKEKIDDLVNILRNMPFCMPLFQPDLIALCSKVNGKNDCKRSQLGTNQWHTDLSQLEKGAEIPLSYYHTKKAI